jgi:hypothetical protein
MWTSSARSSKEMRQIFRSLKLSLSVFDLVCQLEIAVPRDVLMNEARFNKTLDRTLRDLALLKQPARLRLNLDTSFKINTPPKAYDPSRASNLGEPDPIARGETFKKTLSQLLSSLTGWKVELGFEVWTLHQKHNMEHIIVDGTLGDDLCNEFEVQMILPELAEFSHSHWGYLFHKVRHDLAVSPSTSLTLLLSFVMSSTRMMKTHWLSCPREIATTNQVMAPSARKTEPKITAMTTTGNNQSLLRMKRLN